MIRVHNVFGMQKTFDVFSAVGFEGMDFNNDVAEYCSDEHGEQFYRELGRYAAQKGIRICQAHAPFPSSFIDGEKTEKRFEQIVQGLAALGAIKMLIWP